MRIGAGIGEGVEEAYRLLDHQMNFKRQVRHRPQRLDDDRPHADVGHEMAVHDIDVDAVGAGLFRLADLFAQSG